MDQEEAKDGAHRWLAAKPWWSDDEYAIVLAGRASTTWVSCWNSRIYAETRVGRHASLETDRLSFPLTVDLQAGTASNRTRADLRAR